MSREKFYLKDIIEAVNAIERFLQNVTKDKFLTDELLQSAVLHKLTIIGEAASRVSDDLKSRYSEIEWKAIIGFRNIAVHAYFSVKWDIVWVTAKQDTQLLRKQINQILKQDFPTEDTNIEN